MKSLKEKQEKGFTLIELLLVISIVSLLSTFTFFNFTEAKKKAEDAKMQTEASQVKKAIELYKLDHDGKVPNPGLKGQMVREGASDGYFTAAMEKLVPEYLPEIPSSPSGESYAYLATEDETEAIFAASLNYGYSGGGTSNHCSGIIEPNQSSSNYDWENCSGTWGSCSSNDYNTNTESCFTVSQSILNVECELCAYEDKDDDFPDQICAQFSYRTYYGSCNFNDPPFDIFVCDLIDLSDGQVCDGFSNSDFCQCI